MRVVCLFPMVFLGCGGTVTAPDLYGMWGGEHIQLVVTPAGGTLEYDCAAGTIGQPIVPDASGVFDVGGSHTPGHGGPDIEGEVPEVFGARYTGVTNGNRMTVRVVLVDTEQEIGEFTLRLGEAALLFRCL